MGVKSTFDCLNIFDEQTILFNCYVYFSFRWDMRWTTFSIGSRVFSCALLLLRLFSWCSNFVL